MSCSNLTGGLETICPQANSFGNEDSLHEAMPAMKPVLQQRSISPHNPSPVIPLQSNETELGCRDTGGMQM